MNLKQWTGAGLVILAMAWTGLMGAAGAQARSLTPTPSATARPTPTAAKMQFTLSNLNAVPPQGVLMDMYVFGKGGGEEDDTCTAAPARVQPARTLMEPFILTICWPEPGAWPALQVQRPDGKTHKNWLYARNGMVRVAYQTRYDDPVGTYTLRLESKKKTLELQVDYRAPTQPRLLGVPASPFSPAIDPTDPRHELILDRFVPGEKARLLVYVEYGDNLSLAGWQDLTVRGDGRMPVQIDLKGVLADRIVFFAAVGERSGEVHYQADYYWYTPALLEEPFSDEKLLYCPGAFASRWSSGSLFAPRAVVAHTDGSRLRVHQFPGFSSPVIALIPEGAKIERLGGPVCIEQAWFWLVEGEQVRGWVAEADQKDYLIEPLP